MKLNPKWRAGILAAGLFFIASDALALTSQKIGAEYTTDDVNFTMAWDHSTDGEGIQADGYEIKLVMTDKTPPSEYALGRTSDNKITIKRPRAGHFAAYVRAYADAPCNPQPCEPTRYYSTWSLSTDETVATVDGNPMGWWIYWKLPAPSVPIIE